MFTLQLTRGNRASSLQKDNCFNQSNSDRDLFPESIEPEQLRLSKMKAFQSRLLATHKMEPMRGYAPSEGSKDLWIEKERKQTKLNATYVWWER